DRIVIVTNELILYFTCRDMELSRLYTEDESYLNSFVTITILSQVRIGESNGTNFDLLWELALGSCYYKS
ncbi:MAG: hypothetical protein AAFV78_19290, partial [Bacteroidota bacterium]